MTIQRFEAHELADAQLSAIAGGGGSRFWGSEQVIGGANPVRRAFLGPPEFAVMTPLLPLECLSV